MLRLELADLRDAGFDDDELAGIFANLDDAAGRAGATIILNTRCCTFVTVQTTGLSVAPASRVRRLSAWEAGVFASLPRSVRLSGKQAAVLAQIAARLRIAGAWQRLPRLA